MSQTSIQRGDVQAECCPRNDTIIGVLADNLGQARTDEAETVARGIGFLPLSQNDVLEIILQVARREFRSRGHFSITGFDTPDLEQLPAGRLGERERRIAALMPVLANGPFIIIPARL